MAIGSIPTKNRLGIANSIWQNAVSFSTVVLRLPANSLVYQQQLVRSRAIGEGPDRVAMDACCGYGEADADSIHRAVVREIAAHDTAHSRRNISDNSANGTSCVSFLAHRINNTYQIYYVNNEPESTSRLRKIANPPCSNLPGAEYPSGGCWSPRDRSIDHSLGFPNPNNDYPNMLFWEEPPNPPGLTGGCADPDDPNDKWLSIRAEIMAWVFLRLRRQTLALNPTRYHVVLPPSAVNGNMPENGYWHTFYTAVKSGVQAGTEPGTFEVGLQSLSGLGAYHIHSYAPHPDKIRTLYPWITNVPLQGVADPVNTIRKGLARLRTIYNTTSIDTDILISEMGPHWDWRDKDAKVLAGYYDNFRDGLGWWNSWLYWLTRASKDDCTLGSNRFVYGCIHEPNEPPYTNTIVPTATRSQKYLHATTLKVYTQTNMPAVRPPNTTGGNALEVIGNQQYQSSFTVNPQITWVDPQYSNQMSNWYTTPFSACYTVWSQVGTDAVVTTGTQLTGWILNNQAGAIGQATLNLYAGWNTVYFPVYKDTTAFQNGDYVSMTWLQAGVERIHGRMDLKDMLDSYSYVPDFGSTVSRWITSAMIFPVVCYSDASLPNDVQSITVKLTRNLGGTTYPNIPAIHVGRPIVLRGVCSWFIQQ
jgi:hypothetical protein